MVSFLFFFASVRADISYLFFNLPPSEGVVWKLYWIFLPVSCKMDALCCRRLLNSDNKKAIFLLLDIQKDSVVELRKVVSISSK